MAPGMGYLAGCLSYFWAEGSKQLPGYLEPWLLESVEPLAPESSLPLEPGMAPVLGPELASLLGLLELRASSSCQPSWSGWCKTRLHA